MNTTAELPNLLPNIMQICGLGSSVGIAAAYGQDGPGIESKVYAPKLYKVETQELGSEVQNKGLVTNMP
jgi:hypothetical protein